jgi:serine/threonine protein kinase
MAPDLLAPAARESTSRSPSRQRARTDAHEHRSLWDPLKKIGSWLRREEEEPPPPASPRSLDDDATKEDRLPSASAEHPGRHMGLLHRRSSRKAVPGLPRPLTFKRMNSEKRDKLLPVPVEGAHKRAASADRRGSRPAAARRTLSPPPVSIPSISAPDVLSPHHSASYQKPQPTIGGAPDSNIPAGARQVDYDATEDTNDYRSAGEPPPLSDLADSFYEKGSQRSGPDIDEVLLQQELEAKWILNLSMHFRDRSDREKFFITYAEEPNKWRRVTVSCDYRELTPDSLEADLKSLHYQRDKSARIYEAIRDSLPDIQFYDTVTNLKLQTSDGRLHVHVTEDVNEIIPYPSLAAIDHLSCKRFKETAVSFDSHISGFVYKVSVNSKIYIKKEIPGPDAVEEFLYEINALSTLEDSNSVIQFEGIIVDENNELIKGLLISYADQGALVDMLYDFKNTEHMSWERRERWARQIVEGLSEIHEAGFVQGDFTLSNIVIDRYDNAKIIDINRRGCPVGWEPPELARLIESGQRISIYIGVKSDMFQLGMVLWALAEQQDEPERHERPLGRTLDRHSSTPEYFREIVKACLSDNPRERPAAKTLLAQFPDCAAEPSKSLTASRRQSLAEQSDKQRSDQSTTVAHDEFASHRHQRSRSSFSHIQMPSTDYLNASDSYVLPEAGRGRSPTNRSISRNRQSDYSPYPGPRSILSLDDSELENELASLPASRGTRWEQVYVDGDTKLVQRGGLDIDARDFSPQELKEKDVCITTPPAELCSSYVESRGSGDRSLSLQTTVAEVQPVQETTPVRTEVDAQPNLEKKTENEASFSEDTPLHLSTVAELPPPQHIRDVTAEVDALFSHQRKPSSKASFSDRIHHPTPADDLQLTNKLADLENEVAMDTSMTSVGTETMEGAVSMANPAMSFPAPLHQDSGFHAPLHQDSGFGGTTHEDTDFHVTTSQRDLGLTSHAPLHQDSGFTFHPPLHQDSGFNEAGRELISFESETIPYGYGCNVFGTVPLEEQREIEKYIRDEREREHRVSEETERRKEEDGRGKHTEEMGQPEHAPRADAFEQEWNPAQMPVLAWDVAEKKPLEEKVSTTTIRAQEPEATQREGLKEPVFEITSRAQEPAVSDSRQITLPTLSMPEQKETEDKSFRATVPAQEPESIAAFLMEIPTWELPQQTRVEEQIPTTTTDAPELKATAATQMDLPISRLPEKHIEDKASVTMSPTVEPDISGATRMTLPIEEPANQKPLQARVSTSTIRPPSLMIPEFHHGVPLPMDDLKTTTTESNKAKEEKEAHAWVTEHPEWSTNQEDKKEDFPDRTNQHHKQDFKHMV